MTTPTKREIESALRNVGLSARQAKKFVSAAWPVLVGELAAERDELLETLQGLTEQMKPKG